MTLLCRTAAVLAVAALIGGCASTPKRQPVVLTGNIMADGPNAIANGPARDRVLWQYRTAAAAMRQGQFAVAKQNLDDALATVQGVFGPDRSAKQARGYFHKESKKIFIGEPYERAMAFIYRGILYWMDGELDNARACFRSAQFEDSDTENKQYAGDWVLADYLDGLATAKLGGDGSDAFKRALAASRGVSLPPYNPKANVLLFFEFGPGPTKYATGQYGQELRFQNRASPVRTARFKVAGLDIPVAPTDDVAYQATTRGGRVMDHILSNKAVFKSATDSIGDVALVGGLGTALLSGDQTAQQVGLGLALAGLLTKAVSAAATPAADTRAWDNLPQYLSLAAEPWQTYRHGRVSRLGGTPDAQPHQGGERQRCPRTRHRHFR
jgi:tetratricopeptide (TPR) repeat protein